MGQTNESILVIFSLIIFQEFLSKFPVVRQLGWISKFINFWFIRFWHYELIVSLFSFDPALLHLGANKFYINSIFDRSINSFIYLFLRGLDVFSSWLLFGSQKREQKMKGFCLFMQPPALALELESASAPPSFRTIIPSPQFLSHTYSPSSFWTFACQLPSDF